MNDNIKIGSDIHAGDGGYSIGTQEKYDEFVKGRNESLGKMRIRELAEQAGITTNLDTDFFEKDINKWVDYYSEKFAELIVRECGVVAYKTYCQTPGALGIQYKQAIEEHFGVK